MQPVLEYACPAWHFKLTKQQTKIGENVQQYAVHIIAGNFPHSHLYDDGNLLPGWQTI